MANGWTKAEKRLLKRADEHLRKLEAAGGNAVKFAYARAQKDLQRLGVRENKHGHYRFDRRAPENANTRRAIINRARAFLGSQTDTPAQIRALEKKNLARFNKKEKTNLTLSQYAALSEVYDEFKDGTQKVTVLVQAVEKHDAQVLYELNAIQALQVDDFGVPASIKSQNIILDAVLEAMGEDLSKWKASERLKM